MPNALLGAATCGRCAAPLTTSGARCPSCGVLLEPIAPGSAVAVRPGPLSGVVPARGGRRWLATGVDLLVVLLVAVAAATTTELAARAFDHDVELSAIVAVAAALVVLASLSGALRAAGRTPGRAVAGLRTVDGLSGLPPRRWATALVAVLSGRAPTTLTADVRLGRDPRTPFAEAVTTAVDALPLAAPVADPLPPVPTGAIGARLVADSGDEIVVDGPVLLGRAPEPARGVRTVRALPDLSRGVARTHLLADWFDGLLWLTDLGSPGGTAVRTEGGAFRPLLPDVRTAVAPGWQVRLGARTLTVRSLAVAAPEEGGPRGR